MSTRAQAGVRYAGAFTVVVISGVVARALQPDVDALHTGLFFLITIFLIALTLGSDRAVTAALVSSPTFHYFFIPLLHTLTFARRSNVLTIYRLGKMSVGDRQAGLS